jgi:DNA-binding MarR family transcriptional regulator
MGRKPLPVDPVAESRRIWEARWGPESGVALAATASVMRAQSWLLGELNALLSPLGLTFARYEALHLLASSKSGELALAQFVRWLQVHPTSITNIIDRLQRDGLVERVPHATDRRSLLARLTTEGRDVAERAAARLHEARFCLGDIDADQLESLITVIRRVRLVAGDFDDRPEVEL